MLAGVLAVQGAFAEMESLFAKGGHDVFEIRQRRDAERPFDVLVLPGGESTVQGSLLRELGLLDPLRERIEGGIRVFAACAGMILLAREIEGGEPPHFGVLPVTVRRNAYGRQLGSFRETGTWDGRPGVPMTFIRAPAIVSAAPDVEVLSSRDGAATSVRWRNVTAFAWHPELDADAFIAAGGLAFPGA